MTCGAGVSTGAVSYALEAELSAKHTALVLQVVEDHAAAIDAIRLWWAERRIDGVILPDQWHDDKRIAVLDALSVPAVLVGRPQPGTSLPGVWSDDAAAVTAVVDYLVSLGHRRIARVAGLPAPDHTQARVQARCRNEATRTVSRGRHRRPSRRWIATSPPTGRTRRAPRSTRSTTRTHRPTRTTLRTWCHEAVPRQPPTETWARANVAALELTLTVVLTIDRATRDAIVAHARRDHPDEACGVVAGALGSDRPSRLVEMLNAERSPTFYRFDSIEQLKVWREMDDNDEEPVVIYHSHTATDAYPSRTDISLASEPNAHYVLVSTGDDAQFRSFRIVDGAVTEEPVEVVEVVERDA